MQKGPEVVQLLIFLLETIVVIKNYVVKCYFSNKKHIVFNNNYDFPNENNKNQTQTSNNYAKQ